MNAAALLRNPLTFASLVALVVIHALVFVGPLAWTVPPQQTSALEALEPPGEGHPLGTDELGRDELSRLLVSIHARTERTVSLIGWSAGGRFARYLAREHPDSVRQVVSLAAGL